MIRDMLRRHESILRALASLHSRRALIIGTMVLATAGGCTDGGGVDTDAGNTQSRPLQEDFPSAKDLVNNAEIRRLLQTCPVTRPNRSIPPGEEDNPGAERAAYYGNGKLWTVLYGITYQEPEGVKFPWWREVRGRLTIRGHRLDGRAPALGAKIPGGYGLTDFQATRILFPTPGCWRVIRDGERREIELRDARDQAAEPIAATPSARWEVSAQPFSTARFWF